MTFLEAAIELLRQAGRPLHFKELTQRALQLQLLTHVGRTPELAMQSRLAQEAKKGHRTALIRVSPGIFGLRVYDAPRAVEAAAPAQAAAPEEKPVAKARDAEPPPGEADAKTGRRRRRGRGRGRQGKAQALETRVTPGDAAMGPEPGTPEEAIAAAELAEEADAQAPPAARDPVSVEVSGAPAEVDLDALLPAVEKRRGLLQIPGDDALAEYAEDVGGKGITAPVEGELVDARTADEDRPMLAEIQAGRKDRERDRRKQRRRGKGEEKGNGAQHTPLKASPAPPAPRLPTPLPLAQPTAPAPARPSAPLTPASASLADVAYQILHSLPDTRPIHARQIAAMAHKRRLVTGDVEELWKGFKAALLEDARACLGRGVRQRVRHHGGGSFALGTARLEPELGQAEGALSQRAEALAQGTQAALRRRLARLPLPLLEQVARVFLERTGVRELLRVKRVEQTSYLTGLMRHGVLPVRVLIAVRAGEEDASRRAVGELRAGVVAKQLDAGLLLCAGRMAHDAEREIRSPGALITALDGDGFAQELVRAGVGVMRVAMPIAYLDVDFFAELAD